MKVADVAQVTVAVSGSDAAANLKRATREVEKARDQLNRLDRELVRALEAEDEAERFLADLVAQLQLEGLEGKNQAERDARLHVLTADARRALDEARTKTRRARAAKERAQRTYDTARYRHRTWRVITALQSGVGGEDTW